jgi:hypothetical protein
MNDEVNSFIANYRNELDRQRDLGMQNLENNRRNQFQNLMGAANTAGMMYSNFPERAKMQYDTNTYLPSQIKLQQSYQTGLDKLRSNTTNYINQLASINEAISDLNETNNGNGLPNSAVVMNEAGDWFAPDISGGSQFRNANQSPIRFGTAAQRAGLATNQQILDAAKMYLNDTEYKQLYNIVTRNQGTRLPNLAYNVGKNYVDMDYGNRLSAEDTAFLNRLGLKLVE